MQGMLYSRDIQVPLLRQVRDQSVGARREYYQMFINCEMIDCATFASCHQTKKNADFCFAFTATEWGEGAHALVKALKAHSFKRHHPVAKKSGVTFK